MLVTPSLEPMTRICTGSRSGVGGLESGQQAGIAGVSSESEIKSSDIRVHL